MLICFLQSNIVPINFVIYAVDYVLVVSVLN